MTKEGEYKSVLDIPPAELLARLGSERSSMERRLNAGELSEEERTELIEGLRQKNAQIANVRRNNPEIR